MNSDEPNVLIYSLSEILNILHMVNGPVRQAFCNFAMTEYSNEVQNRLVLAYKQTVM